MNFGVFRSILRIPNGMRESFAHIQRLNTQCQPYTNHTFLVDSFRQI